MNAYIQNPDQKQLYNKNIHLYRNPETKKVEYPYENQSKPWYEFQVDRGSASMFCPVPVLRSDRLKRQIVLFKTFWDIAAYQRTIILKKILSEISEARGTQKGL